MELFLVIAFLTPSLDKQLSTPQQHFTFGSYEIDMIYLIPKIRVFLQNLQQTLSHFVYHIDLFWSQIFFTSSFKFVVPSNISNRLAFSGMSNNTFPFSVHFFGLTSSDVRFYFNSATLFLSFLPGGSSISKNSPSTWTVAFGVRS